MLSIPDAKNPEAIELLFEELLLSDESVKGNLLTIICKIIVLILNNFFITRLGQLLSIRLYNCIS